MAKRKEIIGKKFGKLTVIEAVDRRGDEWYWRCRCKCGSECVVRGSHLRGLTVWRCTGCRVAASVQPKLVGDMSYHFWESVLRNAKLRREISVSVTPQEAYAKFVAQKGKCALSGVDLKFPPTTNKYTLGTASLDRIDSSGGYSKDNIQWVHKRIQKMKMELPQGEFVGWCRLVSKTKKEVK